MNPFQTNSSQQSDLDTPQPIKPSNRTKLSQKGLHLTSDFPGGNLHCATIKDDLIFQGKHAILIEFEANSDINLDARDKAWFWFGVAGLRERGLRAGLVVFRWRNANVYRKFGKDRKYRPYVAIKEYRDKYSNEWKTLPVTKITEPTDTDPIEAQIHYKIQPGIDRIHLACNLPYTLSDFQSLNGSLIDHLQTTRNSTVYYHREIMAQSVDGHPVYLLTITSVANVESYGRMEAGFGSGVGVGQRPYGLRKRPEIVVTARVHPSEISSSYCVQGIIQALVKDRKMDFLLNAFIFRIIPIVNVDGVENGHYRLDNYSQNLNRFYGHSDISRTPSVYAIQKLLTSLRQKSMLFMFLDIHGHNSPKPSFIFGNYSQNFYQALENRTFVKIMEMLGPENFSAMDSEFSKRNMSIKQKYDEHSKQASARVFAYQGNCNSEGSQFKPELYVEHSYTLQVHPYSMTKTNVINLPSLVPSPKTSEQLGFTSSGTPSFSEIVKEYKKMGENFLVAVLELIGANAHYRLNQGQDCRAIRKKCLKQILKLPEFYDRLKKQREREKQINRQLFERYYKKWHITQSYKQYLNNPQIDDQSKQRIKECPIDQVENELNKKDSIRKISPVRFQTQSHQVKSKEKIYKKEKSEAVLGSDQDREQIAIVDNISGVEGIQSSIQMGKNQQMNGINLMELKMFQKVQKYYVNSIRSSPRLVNYTPTFSPDKKNVKEEIKNQSELEKRVKRLIFRHKTEIQTKEGTVQAKKYALKFDLQKKIEGEGFKSQKNLFQGEYPFIRNLQPLSRKKSKQVRIKTQTSKDTYNNKYNLNNILFKNQNSNRKQTSTQLKRRIVSTQNPKIQQLLKRVSINRAQNPSSIFDDEQLIKPINRIKGTKNILSNLILLKAKSKNSSGKGLSQAEKQDIIHSISNNCIVYDANHSLIPLMHHSKVYEQLADQGLGQGQGQGQGRGLQGSYRSISPIPKKEMEKNTGQDGDFKQINSMELFKKNNLLFLQKAKNEILQKKKAFKSIQQEQSY